jgi:hypothetical protein
MQYDTQTSSGGIDNWGSPSGLVVGLASKASSSGGRGGGWFLVLSFTLVKEANPRNIF